MKENGEHELLLELLLLRTRYSKRQLLHVADVLRQKTDQDLAVVLESLATLDLGRAPDDRPGKKNSALAILASLERNDPPKYELLRGLERALRSREVAPQAVHLRSLAQKLGLKNLPARREQVVSAVIRALVDLPVGDVRTIAANLPRQQAPEGFTQLANLILHGEQSSPAPASQ